MISVNCVALLFLWVFLAGTGVLVTYGRTEVDEKKRLEQGDARMIFSLLTGHTDLLKQGLDEGARVNAPIDPFVVESVLKLGRAFKDYPIAPPLHFALNYGKRAQINTASMIMRFMANPNLYALPHENVWSEEMTQDKSNVLSNSDFQSVKTGDPLVFHPNKPSKWYDKYHRGYAPASMYALGFGQKTTNSHAAVLQRIYRENPQRFNLTILDEWRKLTGNPPLTHLMLYWQNFDGLYFVVSEWTRDVNERAFAPKMPNSPLTMSVNYASLIPRQQESMIDFSIDPYGITPLHLAAWLGDLPATIFLLHNGGDLRARTHFYGHLPIHFAMFRHHSDIVAVHLAYVMERKVEKEEFWKELVQGSSTVPNFDLFSQQYANQGSKKKKKQTVPNDMCAAPNAKKDTTAAAVEEEKALFRGEARDLIDLLMLQPRNYALVPVLANISERWQFPIQASPVETASGGWYQGKDLQKHLSWTYLLPKLRQEQKQRASACRVPRGIDVVNASAFSPEIYREEYYVLQRPVLIVHTLMRGLGVWANVVPSYENQAARSEGFGRLWQVFDEIFVSRFGDYPVVVYSNAPRSSASASPPTAERENLETVLGDEVRRMVHPPRSILRSYLDSILHRNESLNSSPTASTSTSNRHNSFAVAEAMISLELYRKDFFTEVASPKDPSVLHAYFTRICAVAEPDNPYTTRFLRQKAPSRQTVFPHLLSPHPHYEPFRLIITPTVAITSNYNIHHHDNNVSNAELQVTPTSGMEKPSKVRFNCTLANSFFSTGSTFLQQYSHTGYATGLYHEPYLSSLSNISEFAHTVHATNGAHRYVAAHWDVLLSASSPKHWVLIPPGQFTVINASFAEESTRHYFQQQLHMIQEQIRSLRRSQEIKTDALLEERLSQLEAMTVPSRIWSMDHLQLRYLFLPWLQSQCLGVWDSIVQEVGDVIVIPQEYYYFYYHSPLLWEDSVSSSSSSSLSSSSKASSVTLFLPSVSMTQSFCTWFDTDTHVQSLGYIVYGHRHFGSFASSSSSSISSSSIIAEQDPSQEGEQQHPPPVRQEELSLTDVWRGKLGAVPPVLLRHNRETTQHQYSTRRSKVPIFEMPLH